MAKKKKKVEDKDVLFRNAVVGTGLSTLNFIIFCVSYYFIVENPETRGYLKNGFVIEKINLDLTNTNMTLVILGVIVLTPVLFLVRGLLISLGQLLRGKDSFVNIVVSLGINFAATFLVSAVSIILYFIYSVALGYILGI